MLRAMTAAGEFVRLSLSGADPIPLTGRELQQLLGDAQAWSLVIRQSELFPDVILAGDSGPVVSDVTQAFHDGDENRPVLPDVFEGLPEPNPDESEFLEKVWESRRQASPVAVPEAPWGGEGEPAEITVGAMEQRYAALPIPAPLAEYADQLRKREEEASQKLAALPPFKPGRVREPNSQSLRQPADVMVSGG